MVKSINSTSLYLDIHSLIKVWAPDMPHEISRYLNNHLGLFSAEPCGNRKEVDILLLQLQEFPTLTSSAYQLNSLYGFWLTEYQNQQAVVFNYRGEPDIIVIFSDTIKIFYNKRLKVSSKLYGILLFCFNLVLQKKNGLLFHGAAAKDENNCILLTGHRGAKKTIFLLAMLRNGWDYLSDDKFILHDTNAYLFQTFIPILNHHFDSLPWLAEIIQNNEKFRRKAKLRKIVRNSAQRDLPSYLFPSIERFLYDPSLIIEVNKLFPTCKLIPSAKPSVVIVLSIGPQFKFESTSKNEIIDEMLAIQMLAFHKFSSLAYLFPLYNKSYKYDLKNILDRNLIDPKFLKLTIPDDYSFDRVHNDIKQCLKQV